MSRLTERDDEYYQAVADRNRYSELSRKFDHGELSDADRKELRQLSRRVPRGMYH